MIDDTPFSLYPYNIQEIAFLSIDSNLYSDHVIQIGKLKKKMKHSVCYTLKKMQTNSKIIL